MGTTLALNGAYNLAGSLSKHPHDHEAAFAHYANTMHPIVEKAQKLVPGMPHILHPETEWGVWLTHAIIYLLDSIKLQKVIFMLKGPPADAVHVEQYGFEQITDMPH